MMEKPVEGLGISHLWWEKYLLKVCVWDSVQEDRMRMPSDCHLEGQLHESSADLTLQISQESFLITFLHCDPSRTYERECF